MADFRWLIPYFAFETKILKIKIFIIFFQPSASEDEYDFEDDLKIVKPRLLAHPSAARLRSTPLSGSSSLASRSEDPLRLMSEIRSEITRPDRTRPRINLSPILQNLKNNPTR